jgi:hypothetical protein
LLQSVVAVAAVVVFSEAFNGTQNRLKLLPAHLSLSTMRNFAMDVGFASKGARCKPWKKTETVFL